MRLGVIIVEICLALIKSGKSLLNVGSFFLAIGDYLMVS